MSVTSFRVSVCAGQGFKIPAIVREYRLADRVWPHEPGVTVFGDSPSMFPYRKYVPELVDGGEG